MSVGMIGLVSVIGLLALMMVRVPIATALTLSGVLGYAAAQG
jgi:hypothetical protein